MITNYNIYKYTYLKESNNDYFTLELYLTRTEVDEITITFLLSDNKYINEVKNIFHNTFKFKNQFEIVLSIKEAIYLVFYLSSNNFNFVDKEFYSLFLNVYDKSLNKVYRKIEKKLTISEFEKIFKKLSFEQEDIDNFFINKISKNNGYLNNRYIKVVISENVKKHFRYLDDAKKFDLI